MLSAKFFERPAATIDFRRRQLIFETEQSIRQISRDGYPVRVTRTTDRGKTLDVFVNVGLGDVARCECKLDTGLADTLVLDSRYLELFELQENAVTEEWTGITGVRAKRSRARVSSATLVDAPDVAATDVETTFEGPMIYDGLLGTKFWANRTITLDLAHDRIIAGRR